MAQPSESQVDELVTAARIAREKAYAPYSDFTVGAAILAGGKVYAGCNVENASYGLSICAERSAATTAVTAGERRFDAVAVVGSSADPTPPCGACRQFLYEFGPDMRVISETADGRREAWGMDDVLPNAFGPQHLAE